MRNKGKLFFPFLTVLFCTAVPAVPQDQPDDVEPPPAHLTVLFEWIEVEHADLHELIGIKRLSLEGPALRSEVAKLIEAGKASVVEAIVSHAIDGQRSGTESIEELIYPTEYDPPDMNATGDAVTHATPTAFETRHVGFSVEFDPRLVEGGRLIELKMAIEKVEHRGNRKWGQAESEIEMPDFYTIRSTQPVQFASGRPRLVATHRLPEPVDPARKDPRILVFVRAATHPDGAAPKPEKEAFPGFGFKAEEMALVFECFETDQRRLNEFLVEQKISTRGPGLRKALLKDLTAGKSDLVETTVIAGRTGTKATVQSNLEVIYPTEWDPPEISDNGARILPGTPAALETRLAGQTIKVQPEWAAENIFILSSAPEDVTVIGELVHGKAEGEVRMPHFHTQRLASKTPFRTGEDSLFGTFRPPNPIDPKRKDAVRVWFVRGEVIALDENRKQ